jgi:gas vesicle protein
MSDNNEFGSFLAGFLIGGLVGAAVSLLLAPQSGEETRTIIKSKSIELKDKAATSADDIKIKAEGYASDFRVRAEEYARSKGWMPPGEVVVEIDEEVIVED